MTEENMEREGIRAMRQCLLSRSGIPKETKGAPLGPSMTPEAVGEDEEHAVFAEEAAPAEGFAPLLRRRPWACAVVAIPVG